MNASQAYQQIVEITGGDCFAEEALKAEKIIGLDGRFSLEQLKEIVKVMENLQ